VTHAHGDFEALASVSRRMTGNAVYGRNLWRRQRHTDASGGHPC
jgi:hypothetical protein